MSAQYWNNKHAGICYICRERPIREGHCTCVSCAEEQCRKQQARVARAREEGQCIKCFHRPQLATGVLCAVCYERTKNRRIGVVSVQQPLFTPREDSETVRPQAEDALVLLRRQLGVG